MVKRFLTDMRLDGRIPYDAITDNTRWVHKPTTYPSLTAAVQDWVKYFRLSYWDDQPGNLEIWLEKDALAGLFYQVTYQFDVPLMVTRGYPSITYLNDAASIIGRRGKPTVILYFGDYDPSGMDIEKNIHRSIQKYAPNADVTFERVAITKQQIGQWNLPTRPTKENDSRLKTWMVMSLNRARRNPTQHATELNRRPYSQAH